MINQAQNMTKSYLFTKKRDDPFSALFICYDNHSALAIFQNQGYNSVFVGMRYYYFDASLSVNVMLNNYGKS